MQLQVSRVRHAFAYVWQVETGYQAAGSAPWPVRHRPVPRRSGADISHGPLHFRSLLHPVYWLQVQRLMQFVQKMVVDET